MFVGRVLGSLRAGKTVNRPICRDEPWQSGLFFAAGSKRPLRILSIRPVAARRSSGLQQLHEHRGDQQVRFINSCIAVDIYGQVRAETAGYKQVSGTGGQLTRNRRSHRSNGGKSFSYACRPPERPRTAGVILITPILPPFCGHTPRSCTGFIVTEYAQQFQGQVHLGTRGGNADRHLPSGFRDDMIREAEKMGIWSNTSKREY